MQCRFNFPQFPINKSTFVLGIPKDISEDEKTKRKADLMKIKKFLIRIIHSEATLEARGETFYKFKSWPFIKFLFEVGMFEKMRRHTADYSSDEKEAALARYIKALSASVRGTGKVFQKRSTADMFTNNYNRRLLAVHKANHDLQIVVDQVRGIFLNVRNIYI